MNRGSVRFSESNNTFCEWGEDRVWLKVVRIPGWSVLLGGPILGLHCISNKLL